MLIEDIKNRASNKAWAKINSLKLEVDDEHRFWCVDDDLASKLKETTNKELAVWSYIMSLIEKDI
jgi:hypothetical protein